MKVPIIEKKFTKYIFYNYAICKNYVIMINLKCININYIINIIVKKKFIIICKETERSVCTLKIQPIVS